MEGFLGSVWDYASSNEIISGLVVAFVVGCSGVLLRLLKTREESPNNQEGYSQVSTVESSIPIQAISELAESGVSKDYNELRAHHDSLPPLARSEFTKNIIGLKINWIGYLVHASKKGDILDLTFKVGDLGSIYAEVPYIGHEFMALAKDDAEFQIEGFIESVYSVGNLVVQVTKLKSA